MGVSLMNGAARQLVPAKEYKELNAEIRGSKAGPPGRILAQRSGLRVVSDAESRKIDAAFQLRGAHKVHPNMWQKLGPQMIETINNGQWPRVLAVGPCVLGGLKSTYVGKKGFGGVPGEVFEVTSMKDGSLDPIGMGSAYYAIRHLGIKVVEVFGDGNGTQENTIRSLRGAVGSTGVEIRTISIIGGDLMDVGGAIACAVGCADSRVLLHLMQDDTAIVYNAGNLLSGAAIEAMLEAVRNGVPVLMVFAHTLCGAYAAARNNNEEPQLSAIVGTMNENHSWSAEFSDERDSAIASCMTLDGLIIPNYNRAGLRELQIEIQERGTMVVGIMQYLLDGRLEVIYGSLR
jgi:hypothetical protein